jgi:hypothetical protein
LQKHGLPSRSLGLEDFDIPNLQISLSTQWRDCERERGSGELIRRFYKGFMYKDLTISEYVVDTQLKKHYELLKHGVRTSMLFSEGSGLAILHLCGLYPKVQGSSLNHRTQNVTPREYSHRFGFAIDDGNGANMLFEEHSGNVTYFGVRVGDEYGSRHDFTNRNRRIIRSCTPAQHVSVGEDACDATGFGSDRQVAEASLED